MIGGFFTIWLVATFFVLVFLVSLLDERKEIKTYMESHSIILIVLYVILTILMITEATK